MLLKQYKKYLSIPSWDRWWEKITDIGEKKQEQKDIPEWKLAIQVYCFPLILRNEKVDSILSSAPLRPPHKQFALLVLRVYFQLMFSLLTTATARSFSARPLFIQLIFFLFLYHAHSPCFLDSHGNITSPKICLLHNLSHPSLPLAMCFLLSPPKYHISFS